MVRLQTHTDKVVIFSYCLMDAENLILKTAIYVTHTRYIGLVFLYLCNTVLT